MSWLGVVQQISGTGREDTGGSDDGHCTMFVVLTAHWTRSSFSFRKHFRRVLRRVPFTY